MAELTINNLREMMEKVPNGELITDDILNIVKEEVEANFVDAEERIRERVDLATFKHPAAYFLLGFCAAGAIVWLLS